MSPFNVQIGESPHLWKLSSIISLNHFLLGNLETLTSLTFASLLFLLYIYHIFSKCFILPNPPNPSFILINSNLSSMLKPDFLICRFLDISNLWPVIVTFAFSIYFTNSAVFFSTSFCFMISSLLLIYSIHILSTIFHDKLRGGFFVCFCF